MDYAEPDDAALRISAATFQQAVACAKAKLGQDYFGQVRIEEVVRVRSHFTGERYDAIAVWHVSDEADQLSADEPEYRPDLDLIDGEHIDAG